MTVRAILLILGFTIVAAPGGRTSSSIGAQSQRELNDAEGRKLKAAEAEMEGVLSSLRSKASGNPDAMAKLNRAQAAWVAYRDAHIESLWPSKTAQASYGSVHPMCMAIERTKLTTERIARITFDVEN